MKKTIALAAVTGIAGTLTTAYLSVKAGFKAREVIFSEKSHKYFMAQVNEDGTEKPDIHPSLKSAEQIAAETLTTAEKFAATWKLYAPTVALAIPTIVSIGVAAYNWYKLDDQIRKLEEGDPDAWPTIEISPGAMKDIENGATLMLRQFDAEPNRTFIQFTTRKDGFPAEADEEFNKHRKAASLTEE